MNTVRCTQFKRARKHIYTHLHARTHSRRRQQTRISSLTDLIWYSQPRIRCYTQKFTYVYNTIHDAHC